ncbi:TPA: hypothetical protein N0F65_008086 [Lagenidium giganteum]|uniref:Apoptosis regulatory protein Siva n=1 Tax=Lagenidium giganteum TaxID=4803 RepID=A0AAV2Z0I1_9STRA|nr:TPA: hypothetical protein N0F65_008086 [Lagenidium giganteum]
MPFGLVQQPSRVWWQPSTACQPPPIAPKRSRDRHVPVDAISRMMSAAVTNVRIESSSQPSSGNSTQSVACAICAMGVSSQQPRLIPANELQPCAHCDRSMCVSCSHECAGCSQSFCSFCSTIDCEEMYDRIFCLSCKQDHI